MHLLIRILIGDLSGWLDNGHVSAPGTEDFVYLYAREEEDALVSYYLVHKHRERE